MAKTDLPTPELLRKLLRYNKRTGKLHWRKRPLDTFKTPNRGVAWNERYAGTEAFVAIGNHGYHTGGIAGYGKLLAHRVIAAMILGYWPECVDHDNRVRTDNRWKNINAGTHSDNHKNYSMRVDNTSGVTGVFFVTQGRRWRARIYDAGRVIGLGDYAEMESAIAARREAERRIGYHPRHGIKDAPASR